MNVQQMIIDALRRHCAASALDCWARASSRQCGYKDSHGHRLKGHSGTWEDLRS
jgi:hypothetical protein